MLKFRQLAAILLVAEFLNVEQAVEGVQQFKRCYNTSEEETHCFDVQYDTSTNQPFFTSFQTAQKRCNDMNSTLVVIKNEEIDYLVQHFMRDNNPIGNQYFWLNAYQVSFYDNPDRWHWLNETLPNLPGSAVSYTYHSGYYTAVLEFRSDTGGSQFYLTAKPPHLTCFYVCEYSVSKCSSSSSNYVRLMNGRCYTHVTAQLLVSWYEARNRCLKDGGDLASFENVTSMNFTSLLGSVSQYSAFWIGLRFTWYTWGDAGQELKYTNWAANDYLQKPCMTYGTPTYTWSSRDCNTDPLYVVCHTITPLAATISSVIKTSAAAGLVSSATTMQTTESQQFGPSSSRAEDCICSSQGSLGIGLGVGLGLPLVIFIILTVFFAVKSKRLETRLEQTTRNNITELGAVQAQPVEQVNESTSDNNYQQLNRNLDNSSGTMMYDKLRVAPETQYEDFSTT